MSKPRRYPELRFSCPAPPTIAAEQRSAWCNRCERKVHNLSAMSEADQNTLLRKEPDACISYRRLLPIGVVLMSLGGPPAMADGENVSIAEKESEIELLVVGGAGVWVDPMFMESEEAEPNIQSVIDKGRPSHPSDNPDQG